jgi:type I restriction enzyme S subunit
MRRIKQIKLDQLMAKRLGSITPSEFPNEEFDLYSIPSYDLGVPEIARGNEIGSAKQIVAPRDVLLSKIVPHIRRSWVVGKNRGRRIIASGEWIVFRGDEIDPDYLKHILKCDEFHSRFMETVAGVGGSLLRARPAQVAEIPIPLPPLPEQRRIAAILDKADAIRRKREEGIRLTEELLRSTFLEMFGDPATNPKGWTKVLLSKIVRTGLRNGISPSTNGTVSGRVLILSAITGNGFDSNQVKDGRFVSKFEPDQIVSADDFLICRGNGNRSLVGCGRFPTLSMPETVFPDTMIAARVDFFRVNRTFFEHLWATNCVRRQIENGARTTNGTYKVNQQVLESIEFPLPPLVKQEQFAKIASKLGSVQRQSAVQLSQALFDSLVQLAFKGELARHFLNRINQKV